MASDPLPAERLRVEVVYALPGAQTVIALAVAPGRSVAEAIADSGIAVRHPELRGRPQALCVGIFGRRVSPDTQLSDGDRIEIYRPLQVDPKEARRARAAQKARRKR